MYFETLIRLLGASAGLGFSMIRLSLLSTISKTPYFSTFSCGISTPRIAESVSDLRDWMSDAADDVPPGFQMKSSPMKTRTGSFILYSSTTMAIGTAVPYLLDGSCET